jgi:hypothetical protein
MMLRNEADIIRTNMLYHYSVGITEFYVVDNGSTDETPKMLSELATVLPAVRWTRDDSSFEQEAVTNGLAREAYESGADWVIPIDADEFWSPGHRGFQVLLGSCDAAALEVNLTTFVQDRGVLRLRGDNLLSMTYRVPEPKVSPLDAEVAVTSGEVAFVEVAYPPKWISRASPELSIAIGNHGVDGVQGARSSIDSVQCLHAALRAREVLHAKAEGGRRLRQVGVGSGVGWHMQRWADLEASGQLYGDWAANSWRIHGCEASLHLPTGPSRLTPDTRLRDLVRPFISI